MGTGRRLPAFAEADYAANSWTTIFTDPDGMRLEVTNYRLERRDRRDRRTDMDGAST